MPFKEGAKLRATDLSPKKDQWQASQTPGFVPFSAQRGRLEGLRGHDLLACGALSGFQVPATAGFLAQWFLNFFWEGPPLKLYHGLERVQELLE